MRRYCGRVRGQVDQWIASLVRYRDASSAIMSSRAGERASEGIEQPRDHYIPLRPADLVRRLGDESLVTIFDREQFGQFCQLVEATIHHEYRSRLAELKAAYAPFDPDDDALGRYSL